MNFKGITYKKIHDFLHSKIRQLVYEKTYNGENPIKYLLYQNKSSDVLIVVFSSLTRPGVPARYNYIRTLENCNVNKLFILDDLGPDHRGCYCLGKNREYSIEKDTQDLIDKIKNEFQIKHTIYTGSSKGGWCALNFGLNDKNADIIVGGCQYNLGTYFVVLPNIRLDNWLWGPNYSEMDVEILNGKIKEKIERGNSSNNRIHVHYSDKEHTYEEHIMYMLEDLRNNGFTYDEEVLHYEDHNDLVKYFPQYLIREVDKVLLS